MNNTENKLVDAVGQSIKIGDILLYPSAYAGELCPWTVVRVGLATKRVWKRDANDNKGGYVDLQLSQGDQVNPHSITVGAIPGISTRRRSSVKFGQALTPSKALKLTPEMAGQALVMRLK